MKQMIGKAVPKQSQTEISRETELTAERGKERQKQVSAHVRVEVKPHCLPCMC